MNMKVNSNKVERWDIFEISLQGPETGNPFIEVDLRGVFKHRDRVVEADGFYDGNGTYKIRLMPELEGEWSFATISNVKELDGLKGQFECTQPSEGNHGPVRVRNKYHFGYEDGTPYYPFGTTCYVWNHQGEELEQQTLQTLKNSPFNKMRMCVFPKDYDYNKNEPEYYPFEGSLEKGWDFSRFNPEFFRHLEKRIGDLRNLGIEADLILFHPYDRWGFSKMDKETDDRYLKYIVARLAAYRNIWWSFANEYDLMPSKTMDDWDRFFKIVQARDPYQHLRSIHNCGKFYDHGKPWVTHCSIQSHEVYRADEWRKTYEKPVVIDECCYEGDINHGWGNITAEEMTHRFWEGFVKGGYVGHGETYMHPQDILWWSKGGVLHGQSPERIAFLRKIIESGPREGMTSIWLSWDGVSGGKEGEYYLIYYGIKRPSFKEIEMPEDQKYKVDIIDAWNMTITTLEGEYSGKFRIDLPARQYMAVRLTRCG